MKYILVTVICLIGHIITAQVGIGTTNPTSEFEIATSNTGIPALELNPQSSPLGTTTGQLAVIGDKLYMYDATRGKWLSTNTVPLQYGYAGSADGDNFWFGGDVENNNSGALMPFDGTIICVSIVSSGGNASKRIDLRINGTNVGDNANPTLDGRFNLVSGRHIYTNYNIDFNAGEFLSIYASSTGSSVFDPTAIIFVKWRK